MASLAQSRPIRKNSRVRISVTRVGYTDYRVRASFIQLLCLMSYVCLDVYLTDILTLFFYLTFYTLCQCALRNIMFVHFHTIILCFQLSKTCGLRFCQQNWRTEMTFTSTWRCCGVSVTLAPHVKLLTD